MNSVAETNQGQILYTVLNVLTVLKTSCVTQYVMDFIGENSQG